MWNIYTIDGEVPSGSLVIPPTRITPVSTIRTKFSEIFKRRPAGRGGARDERRSDYSRIPDRPDPFPHESHGLAGIPPLTL